MAKFFDFKNKKEKVRVSPKKAESETSEDFEQKLKAHKRKNLLLFASVFLLLVLIIVGVTFYFEYRVYKDYTVKEYIELSSTTSSKFYEFGEFLLRYTNDGVTYIKESGVVWNQPFDMTAPVISVCGDVVAIAEQGGTTIYVYNTKGMLGEVETRYPIVDIAVSSQGVVTASTDDGALSYLEMYDKDGNNLVTGQTSLTGEYGMPLDLSSSYDAKRLIVSYLAVSGSSTKNIVVFYNFSDIGKNELYRIVGTYEQEDSVIIPRVQFVTDEVAVAIGGDFFAVYDIVQKPVLRCSVTLDGDILSFFYSDEYLGFVIDTGDKNKVCVYDFDGNPVMEKTTDFSYDTVKFDHDNVILYNDTHMIVISNKGKIRYDEDFKETVIDVIVTDDEYTYLAVTVEGIKKIKLK